jgi:hypothetical protein
MNIDCNISDLIKYIWLVSLCAVPKLLIQDCLCCLNEISGTQTFVDGNGMGII